MSQIYIQFNIKCPYFNKMSKTRTKTQLLSQLKLGNIVTLIQTSLEGNFKLIAQTIDDHSDQFQNFTGINQNSDLKFSQLNSNMEKYQKQQNQMKVEIAELKDLLMNQFNIGIQNSQNKANKNNNSNHNDLLLNDLRSRLQKNQAHIKQFKTDQSNKNTTTDKQLSILRSELDKIKQRQKQNNKNSEGNDKSKQLQQIQRKMFEQSNKNMKNLQKIVSQIKQQVSKNCKDIDISNKKIQSSEQLLDNFMNVNYAQFKQQTQNKFAQLDQQIANLKASVDQNQRLRMKLAQQIYAITNNSSKNQQNLLDTEINTDNIKQMQRQMAGIIKKVNQLYANTTNGLSKYDSFQNKNSTINQTQFSSPNKKGEGNYAEQMEEFREEILDRMRDFRNDIMRAIKKQDSRREDDQSDVNRKINALEQAILKLEHLLLDKIDIASFKKMITFLENKISYVINLVVGDTNNQEDATIAKKQWLCLSCDKRLDKYQGKMGPHLINNQLKGKMMDQQFVGGGMTLRPAKSKVDLPVVHKLNAASERSLAKK